MRMPELLVLFLTLALSMAACRTTTPDSGNGPTDGTGTEGQDIPLWVDLDCVEGKPVFGEYSILKMPSEKAFWTLANLEDRCRIYGALVSKDKLKAEICDVRFKSLLPVGPKGQCVCVSGRYDLGEGRPTNSHCCEKYPGSIHCSPDNSPPTEGVEETPDSQ